MSTEIPGEANGDHSAKPGTTSNVAALFPPSRNDRGQAASAAPDHAMGQPDPLQELVHSLQRWDNHFQGDIRDIERRLTTFSDKIRKHDELFPVVNQNFQSMQVSLSSHSDRLGQHLVRLDSYANQLVSIEAGAAATDKEIAALRAEVESVKRGRTWALWLAILALLGLAGLAAVQLGLVEVATGLMRLIALG